MIQRLTLNQLSQLRRLPLTLALGLSVFLFTACGGDGEVLTTYKGGDVTRGEMRGLFAMIYGPEGEAQATIDQQNQLLTNYSLMKIAALKAKADGLESTESVRNQTTLKAEQAQLFAYNVYMREAAESAQLEFYEMQFLYLPLRGAEGDQSAGRAAEATDLLKELNEKKDDTAAVEDLIYERTGHQRYKWLGGYLDPHCVSCTPNPLNFLTDPLKEARIGSFVEVKTPDAIWLIRKFKSYERGVDDLEDIFQNYHARTTRLASDRKAALPEDQQNNPVFNQIILDEASRNELAKQQSQRLQRTETNNALTNQLNKLREDKNMELLPALRPGADPRDSDYSPETPLFRIGESFYTMADLDKQLGEAAGAISLREKLQIANSLIVPLKLLEDESAFQSVKGNDDYEFMLQLREQEALAAAYYSTQQPDIKVTQAQINEQYQIGRQNRFKGKSLAQVADQIRRDLERSQRQAAQQKIQSALTQEYELKIERDKLTANEL